MKKQIKKLSFSTEKIISLNKTQMQDAQGGSGTYNCQPPHLVAAFPPTTIRK
jgi:hypothetical protein